MRKVQKYFVSLALNIEPVDVEAKVAQDAGCGVTLLHDDRVKAMKEVKHATSGVISWSPPQANWNAWTGFNIG